MDHVCEKSEHPALGYRQPRKLSIGHRYAVTTNFEVGGITGV